MNVGDDPARILRRGQVAPGEFIEAQSFRTGQLDHAVDGSAERYVGGAAARKPIGDTALRASASESHDGPHEGKRHRRRESLLNELERVPAAEQPNMLHGWQSS